MKFSIHAKEGTTRPERTPAAADRTAEGTATLRKVDVNGTLHVPRVSGGRVFVQGGEQGTVSKGTGVDARHLIDNRFGAPSGAESLGPQNWKAKSMWDLQGPGEQVGREAQTRGGD